MHTEIKTAYVGPIFTSIVIILTKDNYTKTLELAITSDAPLETTINLLKQTLNIWGLYILKEWDNEKSAGAFETLANSFRLKQSFEKAMDKYVFESEMDVTSATQTTNIIESLQQTVRSQP